MNDTNLNVTETFINMMKKKSGVERLKMGFSMFDMARQLVLASVVSLHTNDDLRRELFLRFYGGDFSNEGKSKILKYLVGGY